MNARMFSFLGGATGEWEVLSISAVTGQPLAPGQIFDVNRFTLAAIVSAHGGVPEPHAPAHDNLDALTSAVDRSIRWAERTVTDIYQSPCGRYLGGEPVFIGDPGGDTGVVICQEFDAAGRKSQFLFFRSDQIASSSV